MVDPLAAPTACAAQVVDADVVLLDQWRLSQYPFGLDEPERVRDTMLRAS